MRALAKLTVFAFFLLSLVGCSGLAEEPETSGSQAVDLSAGDYDGNAAIQLSAIGGKLAYWRNHDVVGITPAGGIFSRPLDDASFMIDGDEKLEISFTSDSVDEVRIELRELSSSEKVFATVRDGSGTQIGFVVLRGTGRDSKVYRIARADLNTASAIASITLSHGAADDNSYLVGTITATGSGT